MPTDNKVSFTAEVRYQNDACPYLVLNDDVTVEVYMSQDDLCPVVQISTSEDTDSWEYVRVYLNDGRLK